MMGDDYRAAGGLDTARCETMYEAYYSYSLNDLITLTPNIQVAVNPNVDETEETEVVCGLRFLLSF